MCTCNLAAWGLQVYLFVYDTKKYANSTTVLLHLSPSVHLSLIITLLLRVMQEETRALCHVGALKDGVLGWLCCRFLLGENTPFLIPTAGNIDKIPVQE